MIDAQSLTKALGGTWHGSYGVAPDIGHGKKDRGLSIANGRQGNLLLHSFHGYPFTEIVASLKSSGHLPPDTLEGHSASRASFREIQAKRAAEARRERLKRIDRARAFLSQCTDEPDRYWPYLANRGVERRQTDKRSLMFCAEAWCGEVGRMFPAMVAAVRDVDGALVGIHRTFLSPDGQRKAPVQRPKLALGPIGGGTVQLGPAYHEVVLSEGIETALAVTQLYKTPCWSALSAGGLKAVLLPRSIRRVTIAADRDDNGVGFEAAKEVAKRFNAEGRDVTIIVPPAPHGDFLDVLNAQKREAVQ